MKHGTLIYGKQETERRRSCTEFKVTILVFIWKDIHKHSSFTISVVHVDKVRLCLRAAATNGGTVHPPGDI
jgi:hypothetical protein